VLLDRQHGRTGRILPSAPPRTAGSETLLPPQGRRPTARRVRRQGV